MSGIGDFIGPIVGIAASVLSGGTMSPLMAGLLAGGATALATGDINKGLMGGITGGMASGLGAGIAGMMGSTGGAAAAGIGGMSTVPEAASLGAGAAGVAGAGELGSGMAGMGLGSQAGMGLGSQAGMGALQSGATTAGGIGALGSGMSSIGVPVATPLASGAMSEGLGSVAPGWLSAEGGAGYANGMAADAPGWLSAEGGAGYANGMAADATHGALASAPSRMGGTLQSEFMGDNLMKRTVPGLLALGSITNGTSGAPKSHASAPSTYKGPMQVNRTQLPVTDTSYVYGGGEPMYFTNPSYHYARGGRVNDGMSDSIHATINGKKPARLSAGEYVLPSDLVSHLGNGSSDAGAQQLDNMVARIRAARTGTTQQAPQINPQQYLPS